MFGTSNKFVLEEITDIFWVLQEKFGHDFFIKSSWQPHNKTLKTLLAKLRSNSVLNCIGVVTGPLSQCVFPGGNKMTFPGQCGMQVITNYQFPNSSSFKELITKFPEILDLVHRLFYLKICSCRTNCVMLTHNNTESYSLYEDFFKKVGEIRPQHVNVNTRKRISVYCIDTILYRKEKHYIKFFGHRILDAKFLEPKIIETVAEKPKKRVTAKEAIKETIKKTSTKKKTVKKSVTV